MAERLTKIVVMGVAACGKTSVGVALAARCGMAFVDGDSLHPARNIAKMGRGEPLTDEDRAPWLDRIGTVLADRIAHPAGVVVACSALRRLYRDHIRAAAGAGLAFVFLDITVAEARRRIALRANHFMPPALVDSQFATLERPLAEPDVVTISRLVDPAQTAEDAMTALDGRSRILA